MTHPDLLLATYRDLTTAERRELDAHLAICDPCRATLAVYQQQDATLTAIPAIQPRSLHSPDSSLPSRTQPFGILHSAFRILGNTLSLGGLAALLWFFALQLRATGSLLPAPTAPPIPGSPIAEPGYTLPPIHIQPPSPWLPALPWISAALLLIGLLFILSRRSLWPTAGGAVLSLFLLSSFVPPLSTIPNPAALYWRVAGGYSYDPHLPFKNNFLIAGRPENDLKPFLDDLIGKVGLTPLDPVQPLARYEILRVALHPVHNRTALVTTRFIYADGSSRIYPVPLLGPTFDASGFLLAGWRADGLQRLRSQHLDLPGQPFATSNSPIRLGPARRLDLNPQANRLDEANPGHWAWNSVRVQHLVWSPDGTAFLAAMETENGMRQLWMIALDGSAPMPVGGPADTRDYGWSPDGGYIVFMRVDPDALAVDATHPYAISVAAPGRETRMNIITLAAGLDKDRLPGLAPQGVMIFNNTSLWLAPYDGSDATLLAADLTSAPPFLPPRPSPDGLSLAFTCGPDLCVQTPDALQRVRLTGLQISDIAWSPDGSRLAVVQRDPNNLRPVQLLVFTSTGQRLFVGDIAPGEATEPPQWTADSGAVFVQTYPQDGRRIIAVDLASGQILDLSQEHWDAYFALSPNGTTLLLNNGRGDFWEADVLREQLPFPR